MNRLDYLYPPRCPICGKISGKGICDPCRRGLRPIGEAYCLKCGKPLEEESAEYCPDCEKHGHAFEAGRAVFSYQGKLKASVYRLKYQGKKEYAAVFGAEMARALGPWIRARGISRIVPVPLHRARQRERGYNQAALLAKELGRRLDLPVDTRLLRRVRPTMAQKALSASERRANLSGAFQMTGMVLPNEGILLVDDIYTTGSTADAVSACLKKGGKCRVYVVAVAIGG